MASASFVKPNSLSSPWIGQRSFAHPSASSPPPRVSFAIRTGAYSDELVKTAVKMTTPAVKTGLFVGLNKGHVVTRRELAPRPNSRKGIGELGRLSSSMKKMEKALKDDEKHHDELYRAKFQKSNDRTLALIESSMDIVVANGLLQLATSMTCSCLY